LEGTSLAPLLDDPNAPWSKTAISEYPKGGHQGTALRTDRYRYVEWRDKSGKLVDRELYDHQNDPEENENVAGKAENAVVIDRLAVELEASRDARKAK
jgi:hypothetical protein